MVKLLLFPFALILTFASVQADDEFNITDANKSWTFRVAFPSTSLLAFSTNAIKNKITFEGFLNLRNNPQRLFEHTYNSFQSNPWNLFTIHRTYLGVTIYPGYRTYEVNQSYDLNITIKSTKNTAWKFCDNIYGCALTHPAKQSTNDSCTVPTPSTRETALNFTSIILLSICCVLVAIVIGMTVYIIRGRRASLNEPGSNMNSEAIYEDVQLPGNVFRAQQNHEIKNVIYGAVIPRQA
ncbi:uncharacterized protein [Palaemon carinicauda]|uniref:uncharacterized protein isoform X1 n=1 Tax=Palaemon carinicauda TaxID=392227 RepID=UPI0035B5EDC5